MSIMKKYIFLLFLFAVSTAYSQTYTVNGQAIRFANRLGIPTKDTLSSLWPSPADTSVITIRPQDSTFYFRYKGRWRKAGEGGGGGAADSLVFATLARLYKVSDSLNVEYRQAIADSLSNVNRIKAATSAGGQLKSNSGALSAAWGLGGGSNFTVYDFGGYATNRASNYTSRSFTDKNYVDSIAALLLRIADTASMLSSYAKASQLNNYLPLSGGTLTGALNGTSASFSGNVSAATFNGSALGSYAFRSSGLAELSGATFTGNVNAPLFSAVSSSTSGNFVITSNVDYGVQALGSSGGSRNIFLAGQSGFSNGFTVRFNGSAMLYDMVDGNLNVGGTITAQGITSTAQGNNIAVTVDSAVTSNYTLALTDAGRFKIIQNTSGAITITIPANSTVAFPIGTQITFTGTTFNAVNFVGATDVTLLAPDNLLSLTRPFTRATIVKGNTNRWYLNGDLN